MFGRRDGQPPWEFVVDERDGVHAWLSGWIVKDTGGKTERGCMDIWREGVRWEGNVVDDWCNEGVEAEQRVDGNRPSGEGKW